MLSPELKAKWIAALRSGKYPQGRAQLRDEQGFFCCLGVLCEVAEVPREGLEYHVPNTQGEWTSIELPLNIAGLDDETSLAYLAEQNDSGTSFDRIADWIEASL